MFISVLKLTPIVAARFQYETDFRPPCIDPRLRTRGIAVRDRLVIRQGVSRFSPPTQYSLDVSKTASLPPSYLLRISRELFSSSVSLSQSTDYTVTEFVSETVSDLSSESLASISLSTKYCLQWRAPPPVIPPFSIYT